MNGAVINGESTFCHHFFEIPIAQGIAAVLANSEQDDPGLEMLPLEQFGRGHWLELNGRRHEGTDDLLYH
jgi:hypothetical protein